MNCTKQTPIESYLCGYTTQRILYHGFFDEEELKIFTTLIINRRNLPIYMGDCWRCYECLFECRDFETMAKHIMKDHKCMI